MPLTETIKRALATAERLRERSSINEANTKATVIEPLLAGLGWDPTDPDIVDREFRVYDGTFLDYALRDQGTARLFVEAKALGETLTDPRFVSQAVNYANNEGVVWCVLTDGLKWRIYKSNEGASMDRKLLQEIDLGSGASVADSARKLQLLGRDSVVDGDLDAFGDRIFTDGRVRAALAKLGASPPPQLTAMIADAIGRPAVPDQALQASLARIFDSPLRPDTPERSTPTTRVDGEPTKRFGVVEPPRGQTYPLDHHLGSKSALVVELFEAVNDDAVALGPDVTRRVRKQYIGYYRGKRSFATVELQQRRAIVYLGLSRETARPWNDSRMRDVAGVGHFGMGDVEYSLDDPEDLAEVRTLLTVAYSAVKGMS